MLVICFLPSQADRLTRSTVRSLLFQSLASSEVVRDLVDKEVRSEKDFEWKIKPRCILSNAPASAGQSSSSGRNAGDKTAAAAPAPPLGGGEVVLEMLHLRHAYGYEHLGDCPHPSYSPPLRHHILALLAALRLKQLPLVRGPPGPGCGKLGLVTEAARLLGVLLVVR